MGTPPKKPEAKKDLTRLEELDAFEHLADPESDKILGTSSKIKSKLEHSQNAQEEEEELGMGDFTSSVSISAATRQEEKPPEQESEPNKGFGLEDLLNTEQNEDRPSMPEEQTPDITVEESDPSMTLTEPLTPLDETPPPPPAPAATDGQYGTINFGSGPVPITGNIAYAEETPAHNQDKDDKLYHQTDQQTDRLPSLSGLFQQTEVKTTSLPKISPTKTATQPLNVTGTGHKTYTPERFQEVRDFAQHLTYGPVTSVMPAYSILMRNIKSKNDAESILGHLQEYGMLNPENEKLMRQSLNSGSLLIPHISEYAAIYLAHIFRRFDCDIQMGLADEIHPSDSYQAENAGLVDHQDIRQNHAEYVDLQNGPISLESIIISTTPTLENYEIIRYLEVVTEHALISWAQLKDHHQATPLEKSEEEIDVTEMVSQLDIYRELSNRLRVQALKLKGNAVIGLRYQILAIPDEPGTGRQYKITCTGNVVWVIGKNTH
ncbi:MAG: heavy metal-binding domain-containing protein [Pseudomonadota bacterium]